MIGVRDELIANEPWTNTKGTTVVPKGKRRISGYDDVKTFNFDWPKHEEVSTKLRDILETEVDEKYYLSDDKTAKLVAQLTRETDDGYHAYRNDVKKSSIQGTYVTYPEGCSHALTAAHKPMTDEEPRMLGHLEMKGHDALKRVYSDESVRPTLTTMGGGNTEPKIAEVQEVRPVLTPERMEKRQNGRRFKDDGEESFTLTSQDRHGIAIREATKKGYAVACEGDAVNFQFPNSKTRRGRVGKETAQTLEATGVNQGTPIKEGSRYRIRKLTPLECFRLQSFTDESHQALIDAGISDSQRYKMAGNAVTVSVIEAIGARLLPLLS